MVKLSENGSKRGIKMKIPYVIKEMPYVDKEIETIFRLKHFRFVISTLFKT